VAEIGGLDLDLRKIRWLGIRRLRGQQHDGREHRRREVTQLNQVRDHFHRRPP
jgi:hypothetical protein